MPWEHHHGHSPGNRSQLACLKARMAARVVTRTHDGALRPVGLRATQLSVLVAVAIEGAISIAALGKG